MLNIIAEKCKGCGLCIKQCPFDALSMKDGIAVVDMNSCNLCGACVESCNFDAIEILASKGNKQDISGYQGVWVLAEQRGNELLQVSLELISEGRKLADDLGTELSAVLLGSEVKGLSRDLIAYGADRVYLIEDKKLDHYRTGPYANVITELINEYKPEILLLGATHNGRDLGPRISARLRTGLTADCTKLEVDKEKGLLLMTRPAFGGNLMATIICPDNRPQMSTVRPGVMVKGEPDYDRNGEVVEVKNIFNGKKAEVVNFKQNGKDVFTKIKEVVKAAKANVNLEEAEIIISGGRGVGTPEGFSVIKELAATLGGEVGASRAVVDEGWIDKDHQVGQTGKTVHPKLYIACGISGAIQHRAGMQESDYIIAINTDSSAPIFEICDYGIVGDLHEVVPVLAKCFADTV